MDYRAYTQPHKEGRSSAAAAEAMGPVAGSEMSENESAKLALHASCASYRQRYALQDARIPSGPRYLAYPHPGREIPRLPLSQDRRESTGLLVKLPVRIDTHTTEPEECNFAQGL